MPMRVAFLAAECEPWAKTGGLADVVDALARALGRLPRQPLQPVDVYLPRYRQVTIPQGATRSPLRVPDPHAATGATDITIVDVAADGYRLRLVDHPASFDRDGIYGDERGDYGDNAWRFGLFCRAALEANRHDPEPVDVLHLHDWHTTPASILRKGPYKDDPVIGPAAVVHTVHNLAYHGWTPRDQLPQLGLAPGDGIVPADAERFDLLRAGIELADVVTTVSETFAKEAVTPAFGRGLEGALLALGDRFTGILNGLDLDVWDPSTDPALASPYDRADRNGKVPCRRDLLTTIGFDPDDSGPVLAMIGRLDPQKGFDLLAAATPSLVELGGRIVVMGAGQAALADPFRALAAADPQRVALIERFDRDVARRVYAGADLFVMPSRFEPCGQGQMIALRYGTPPVVRRTGGLAESVIDVTEHPTAGTGFHFDEATPEALVVACRRAMQLRAEDGAAWMALIDRAMAVDFDWIHGAAPRYLDTYRRAVDIRRRQA